MVVCVNTTRSYSGVFRKLPAVLISLSALLLVVMMFSANLASAGPGPKAVRGYIWDNMGNTVEGAHVLVEIINPGNGAVKASGSYDSDEDGFYSVLFGNFDWDVGDTIKVTATYNSVPRSNSTVADANPIQMVDVTFPFEIPQMGGGWLGLLVSGGAVAAVALVIMGMPKKKR
jgi:hypothetical protein